MTVPEYELAVTFIAIQDEAARPFLALPAMLSRVNTVRLIAELSGREPMTVARDCARYARTTLEALDEG